MSHTSETRRRARRRSTVTVCCVTALILAACGSNSIDTTSGTTSTPTTSEAVRSAEHVERGGLIKIGIEARPASLDPLTAAVINTSGWAYANDSIYDGLVGRSPMTGLLEDRLATRLEPKADFTVWDITLREHVTFQDGSPFDATVAVANLAYRASPDHCRCAANYSAMTATVLDPTHFTITLTAPDAHLPESRLRVAMLPASLLRPDAAGDRDRRPIGTGAFRLVDRDQLIFEKNPHYWRTDDRGRALPYLDRIQLVPIADGNVRILALDKGDIDMMEAYDGATIAALRADDKVTTKVSPGVGSTLLVFNMTKAPFDDPQARRAVALAVDRDAIGQSLAHGGAEPVGSFFSNSPFAITGTYPDHDLAEAQRLTGKLEGEKGAEAVAVDMVCAKLPDAESQMAVLANQLRDAGFRVTLRMLDIGEYAALAAGGTKAFGIACSRITSSSADPSALSNFLRSDGPANFAGYRSTRIDALFDRDEVTVDPAGRTKIYQEINDLLIKDLPYMPLLVSTSAIATRRGVEGLTTPTPEFAAHVDTAWLWHAT